MAYDYPLIYDPIDYGPGEFLLLALLIFAPSAGLIYINFPVLTWTIKILKLRSNLSLYYILMTLMILNVATILTGYLESFITAGVEADPFYYYECVSNSCVYLLTGNVSTLVVALLFVMEENKKRSATNS